MQDPDRPPTLEPGFLKVPRSTRRFAWVADKARRRWIALAVLFLGLLFSILAGWQVRRVIQDDAVRQFAAACDAISIKIRERLTAYAVLLQGGQALFASSDQVDRDEWRTYVETVNADDTVPGFEGIGFSLLIAPHELQHHENSVRQEGFPDYAVHPPGKREVYSSIVYLEPFAGRNLRAFGYDMFSETVRRRAMEQARDTGQPALSGKVTLIQESGVEETQAGTLMYVPVYRHGAPVNTLQERRAALFGWVYSPYRMNDLMSGTIPEWTVKGRSFVDLHIYDSDQPDESRRLYDTDPDGRHHHRRAFLHEQRFIDFNGRRWLLDFNGSQAAGEISYTPAWMIAGAGLVISGLLFGMLLLLYKASDARSVAEGFAEQIRGMAYHDSLTKLPNRRLLRDRLEMALAAGRREDALGALMLLDLDNFKPLNDEHGHAAGDALLKEVASRLGECVRATDTVARLGGDEFVILLVALDRDAAAARRAALEVAEKIRAHVEQPYLLHPEGPDSSVEHRCSCSIGIALFAGDEPNQSALVRRADDAMYQAKKHGRNRVALAEEQPAAGPA